MKRLFLVPYTFVLMNWAAISGLYCFLRGGDLQVLWSKHHHALREHGRA